MEQKMADQPAEYTGIAPQLISIPKHWTSLILFLIRHGRKKLIVMKILSSKVEYFEPNL